MLRIEAHEEELLARPGVPDGHNRVYDGQVRDLQAGDFLLGSRQVVVRKFGLPGAGHHELSVYRVGQRCRNVRRVVWGARTTIRFTRREA